MLAGFVRADQHFTKRNLTNAILLFAAARVAEERERCAKIVEGHGCYPTAIEARRGLAAALRATPGNGT